MPRHIFTFEGRTLRMQDAEVALVNHFLALGAQQLGNESVAASLRRWQWVGPGQWLNVAMETLTAPDELFVAAEQGLAKLGAMVSASYVQQHLPDFANGQDWDARVILDDLRKLQTHLRPRPKAGRVFAACLGHFAAIISLSAVPLFQGHAAALLYWTWPLWLLTNIWMDFANTRARIVAVVVLTITWLALAPTAWFLTLLMLGART
jgi:hypothetical protein